MFGRVPSVTTIVSPPPYGSSVGEARTEAYVQAHGGDDAVFDQFVEPASLILATLLKACLPKTTSRQVFKLLRPLIASLDAQRLIPYCIL